MKRLVIKREVLRDLDGTRLRNVAGGLVLTGMETYRCPSVPVKDCVASAANCVPSLHGCTTGIECP